MSSGAFLFRAAQRAADDLGLDLTFAERQLQQQQDMQPERIKTHAKTAEHRRLLEQHVDKPQHGVFYRNVEALGLSKDLTFSFLKSTGLKSETEGFLIACQDGVINTLVYRTRFAEIEDTRCRACHQEPETLMHLPSACKIQATTSYIYRHNSALRVLYYHFRHFYDIDHSPLLPYTTSEIEAVVENERCRIYWNYAFPTTRLIRANKPDIVLMDKNAEVLYVVEFSAPAETNIIKKEEEKRAKYSDLLYELRRLYPRYSVQIVVLVIGVLGGMRNTLLSELKKLPPCRNSTHSS